MSATIEITTQVDLQNDASIHVGDKNTSVEVLVTTGNVLHLESVVVADNYTVVTLWSSGNGGLTTFTWGLLITDSDVLVQVKNDLGTAEYDVINVPANVPFYFGSTTRGRTSSSLTTTVHTTGLGNVSEIKCQNNVADAVGDATVSLYLFK